MNRILQFSADRYLTYCKNTLYVRESIICLVVRGFPLSPQLSQLSGVNSVHLDGRTKDYQRKVFKISSFELMYRLIHSNLLIHHLKSKNNIEHIFFGGGGGKVRVM